MGGPQDVLDIGSPHGLQAPRAGNVPAYCGYERHMHRQTAYGATSPVLPMHAAHKHVAHGCPNAISTSWARMVSMHPGQVTGLLLGGARRARLPGHAKPAGMLQTRYACSGCFSPDRWWY